MVNFSALGLLIILQNHATLADHVTPSRGVMTEADLQLDVVPIEFNAIRRKRRGKAALF